MSEFTEREVMNQRIKASDFLSNTALLLPAIRLFNAIRKTQPTKPAVGVCLEGDTKFRLMGAVALYRNGKINRVIVSGGVNNPQADNLPAALMKQYLMSKGLPAEVIELEEQSRFSHDHPVYVNSIVKRQGFTDLIVITSGYHLLRAYLRFLEELFAQDHPYILYGYPVGTIGSWFQKSPTEGRYRICSFYCDELTKIRTYKDLASFDEAWKYIHSLRDRV
jgi:uncharacterized SAM-binding protein YcdF (DUF218 family)